MKPTPEDRAYAAAVHEAGHVVIAQSCGWLVGEVTLESAQLAPPDEADPLDRAMIDLGGGAAVWLAYSRAELSKLMRVSETVHYDNELLRLIGGIRDGSLRKGADGQHHADKADALAAIIEDDPGADTDTVIVRFHEIEHEARVTLRERWREVVKLARALARRGRIDRRSIRYLDY